MSVEWTWTSEEAMRVVGVLGDAGVKGTVVLLLAWGVTWGMRRGSAAVRHWVWVGAMVGLVMVPMLGAVMPGWRVLPRWAGVREESRVVAMVARPGDMERGRQGEWETRGQGEGGAGVVGAQVEKQSGPVLVSVPWVMVWVWGLGVGVMVVPVVVGMMWVRGLRRRSALLGGEWGEMLGRLKVEAGVKRGVELRENAGCVVPLTFGVWWAVIVMPTGARGWPEERRRMALLHELGHVARWDCLTQVLVRLVRAVYWFHPLAWVAAGLALAECERACDDRVLGAGTRASTYAEALMEYAAPLAQGGKVPMVALAMARVSTLEGRLLAILDGRRNRRGVTWRWVVGVLVVAVGIVVPLACTRSKGPALQAVEVVWRVDTEGHPDLGTRMPRKLTLNDPADVQRLAAYFPGLGEGKTAHRAGGWMAYATFTFRRVDGSAIHISTNPELTAWSEGRGDWAVRGDLNSELAALPWAWAAGTEAGPSKVEHVQLKSANAGEVAKLVNAMFDPTNARARPGDADGTGAKSRVSATADARTNTVVVTGPEEQVKQAMELIAKVELIQVSPGRARANNSVFFIVKVRTAKAAEVAAAMRVRYTNPNEGAATAPVTVKARDAFFVPNPDTNSVLVTCTQVDEEKIRAEIAALDQAAAAGTRLAAGASGATMQGNPPKGGTPNGAAAGLREPMAEVKAPTGGETPENAYYEALYERYKAAVLAGVKAGDKAAVAKATAAFNESIGGKILFVSVWRAEGDEKFTHVYMVEMDKKGRLPPAINYGFSERVHVRKVDDWVLLETSSLPPPATVADGRWRWVEQYADDVYITMGVLPATEDPQVAVVRGWIEDIFKGHYRDFTKRTTVEYGPLKRTAEGNWAMRYKYEAVILDKVKMTMNQMFTFTPEGKYLSEENVVGFPMDIGAVPEEKREAGAAAGAVGGATMQGNPPKGGTPNGEAGVVR